MKNKTKRNFRLTLIAAIAFVIWTIAITMIDLQAIGPRNSVVGFATINGAFHKLTGVHMWLYDITDWLSLVAIIFVLGFAMIGLIQLIKRKNLWKVDADLLILGVFYILVIAGYLIFEKFAINYRPIIIEGKLEASYPSSTTLLILSVMPTAMMQLQHRIKNLAVRKIVIVAVLLFTAFMVIGRLVSGVHWLTDIVGGVLLSTALVMLYYATVEIFTAPRS